MADDWYAWTPVLVGKGDKLETIKVGSKVTPEDMGTDGEGFMEFVASGAVKAVPYPDMPPSANQQSPIEYLRSQAFRELGEENIEMVAFDPAVAAASIGPLQEGIPVAGGVEMVDPETSVDEVQAAMEKQAAADKKAQEAAAAESSGSKK